MKRTVGKILLIVSIGCVVLAFATLFLPLKVNFTQFDDVADADVILGTGTVTSLFTCLLCLPCKIVCHLKEEFGGQTIMDSYRMHSFSSRAALPGLIQLFVIAALIIFTVVILILLLMNKYHGKKKVFLSIIFLFLLVVTAASMLFEKAIVSLTVKGIFAELTEPKIEYIRMKGLALAPLSYMACGAGALIIYIIGLILNRDEKKVKVKTKLAKAKK